MCVIYVCHYVSYGIIIVDMFYPYADLFCTLTFDWLLHRSIQCCWTPGVYRRCRNRDHLLVHVTLTYLTCCHKNIPPDATMRYY